MSDPRHPYVAPSLASFGSAEQQELDASGSHEWAVPSYSLPAFAPPASVDAGRAEEQSSLTSRVDRAQLPKVAIPRSANPTTWTSSGRVSRACENCREQKAKCSGHRPTCQRCQEAGVTCSYGDRKREKTAKLLSDLTSQVQAYEQLLRDLYPKLDAQSMQQVERVMTENKRDSDLMLGSQMTASHISPGPVDPSHGPGSFSAGQASSLGAVDYTEEDFNRDVKVQAIGFVGEHSELAWLYRLKRDLEQGSSSSGPLGPGNIKDSIDRPSVSSLTYFLDDAEFTVIPHADASERPPQEVADKLVDSYFNYVHAPFPILGKMIFLQQYKSFYANPFVRPGKRWLAIMNLVFAISARYSQILLGSSDEYVGDHLMYFSRAWKLSVSDVALLDHPNLQQVQVEGLTSFYLLSIGQINRSWRICGISVRSAVTMGLNLRNESNRILHDSKEIRYRVWWALYALDTILSAMTGRPPSTSDGFCTTPFPVPFKEEDFRDERIAQLITDQEARSVLIAMISKGTAKAVSDSPRTPSMASPGFNKEKQAEQAASGLYEFLTPSVSLWFFHFIDLTVIMREVIDSLYAPGAAMQSWLEVEKTISDLQKKLDNWLSQVPAAFQFQEIHDGRPFRQQIVNLAMRYYSTRIILCQPCLRRYRQVPVTAVSDDFCAQIAVMCVESAGSMINLLPDVPDATWLYGTGPWWCILHYLMQAASVLLIELFSGSLTSDSRASGILRTFHKALGWLQAMSQKDPSSQRAFLVCMDIYATHASRFGLDIEHKN